MIQQMLFGKGTNYAPWLSKTTNTNYMTGTYIVFVTNRELLPVQARKRLLNTVLVGGWVIVRGSLNDA